MRKNSRVEKTCPYSTHLVLIILYSELKDICLCLSGAVLGRLCLIQDVYDTVDQEQFSITLVLWLPYIVVPHCQGFLLLRLVVIVRASLLRSAFHDDDSSHQTLLFPPGSPYVIHSLVMVTSFLPW